MTLERLFLTLVWVDANPKECHSVNFHVGAGVTTSRAWTLKVVQYDCGVEDIAGPQGCLQYHTADTGTIESFNFPTTAALGATSTYRAGWLKKQINTSNAHVCLFQQLTCPISIMIFASEEIPTCVPFALLEALLVLMSSLIKAHLD
jgi:hypothetical protein